MFRIPGKIASRFLERGSFFLMATRTCSGASGGEAKKTLLWQCMPLKHVWEHRSLLILMVRFCKCWGEKQCSCQSPWHALRAVITASRYKPLSSFSVSTRSIYRSDFFILMVLISWYKSWKYIGPSAKSFPGKIFSFTKLKYLHHKVANHEMSKNDEKGTYKTFILNFVSIIRSTYI